MNEVTERSQREIHALRERHRGRREFDPAGWLARKVVVLIDHLVDRLTGRR